MTTPRPSDIPYPPDSPEGREWTRALLAAQRNDPDARTALERQRQTERAAAEQAMALTPEQAHVSALMLWIEQATGRRPDPDRPTPEPAPAPVLTPEQIDTLTAAMVVVAETVAEIATVIAKAFADAADAIAKAFATPATPATRTTRTTRLDQRNHIPMLPEQRLPITRPHRTQHRP